MSDLHDDLIVIDGLVISNWSRSVFEHMHRGGLTAANCTCCVWEGFSDTMANVARFKAWIEEHGDILTQVYTTDDIARAKREGKVGIILGWQNTSGIDDRIGYLRLFKELGVGVMQLTYNTQNLVGSGCWEGRDGGLSDFGRELIDEMNRLGIVVDLSHVGDRTSREAIEHSRQPVAFTHCCPMALKDYPRNKPDDLLKLIVEKGGFVGFATYPLFLPKGNDTTLDDCVEGLEYVVDLVGEDAVGIGTDFTQDQDRAFFDYLSHDKGSARRLIPPRPGTGAVLMPEGLRTLADYPNLTAAMEQRGWSEARIRKVMGENWLRFLRDVWGA
ncbi:MAG: dipeptidase [Hyphomicrobiales bacterium]|nr:dipeptidase [Hyphomicrobiales bacterium]